MPVSTSTLPVPSKFKETWMVVSVVSRWALPWRDMENSYATVLRSKKSLKRVDQCIVFFGRAQRDAQVVLQHGISADVADENPLRKERIKEFLGARCGHDHKVGHALQHAIKGQLFERVFYTGALLDQGGRRRI